MKTVGQLINELQKYDPNREIYILYDCCYRVEPEVEELTVNDVIGLDEDEFHVGDLVMKS